VLWSQQSGGYAGVAQLVEHLPSKQDVASSNLVARSSARLAWLIVLVDFVGMQGWNVRFFICSNCILGI
jgi:hypothetical protein